MSDTYIVEGGKLKHNGVLYKSGDNVKLEDSQAAPLLKIGRVKAIAAAPSEPATPPAQPPVPPQAPVQPAAPAQIQPSIAAPSEPHTGQPTAEDIARTAAEVQ